MQGPALHFIGIGGSGMSALARVLARRGVAVSGSDRARDQGQQAGLFHALEKDGIVLHPQDGQGVRGAVAVVISGAVESSVPDLARARAEGIPVRHRSEVLAEILHGGRGIAVAGTSGKSTVAAMIAWVLRAAGREPTFLGGAPLAATREPTEGAAPGPAAWVGASDLVVIEADESDDSLPRYAPAVGLVTNLSHDHHELRELRGMFAAFAAAVGECLIVNADRPETAALQPRPGVLRTSFGLGPEAEVRGEVLASGTGGCHFRVGATAFDLRLPGRFNVENALAAVAAARHLGLPDARIAAALATFPGVARRMETIGAAAGVEVLDDFAHNPDKVSAALAALRETGRPLRLLFQLHGFGPARMHRAGLVRALADGLGPGDRLLLLPIFFAGGSVTQDITAEDYARDLRAAGVDAGTEVRDEALPARVAASCRPGDRVVVMGARDPTLPELARAVLRALELTA